MAYASHLVSFLLLLPFSITSQTLRDISLGSSLSTTDKNPSWPSPSGEFAFGFYPLPGDMFLLAIWFDKIPEKTVIWSANGDNLAPSGSKVDLTTTGQLILSDPKGQEIWRANTGSGSVTSAAMLDTGNFVLRSKDSNFAWQSFDIPTDTLLPSQVLGIDSELSSRLTKTDFSKGRFRVIARADGYLAFHLVNVPTQLDYATYWVTDTPGSNSQLVFNSSGYVYLIQTNGSTVVVSTKDFYQRITLDFDGVLRQYVYPKAGSGSWSALWSEPHNPCISIISDKGSGYCGFNSYCRLDDSRMPVCACPPGYSFLDPNNTYSGCKQDFPQQSCDLNSAALFELREMVDTDWPLSDYEQYYPTNEEDCRKVCLSDCFCAVSIFRNANCWKKKIPLSNGKMDPSVGGKALIKVSRSKFT